MVPARRIVPGILHVDADIVAAFDLDAVHGEHEILGGRNPDHALRSLRRGRCSSDVNDVLRQECPLLSETSKAAWLFKRTHFGQELCEDASAGSA